jgi:hypothetical protein
MNSQWDGVQVIVVDLPDLHHLTYEDRRKALTSCILNIVLRKITFLDIRPQTNLQLLQVTTCLGKDHLRDLLKTSDGLVLRKANSRYLDTQWIIEKEQEAKAVVTEITKDQLLCKT